jgi:hypothetical protein
MTNFIQLRGQLSIKRQKRLELISSGAAKIEAIRDLLATARTTPFSELKLVNVTTLAHEALVAQTELQLVLADIAIIEEELGQ